MTHQKGGRNCSAGCSVSHTLQGTGKGARRQASSDIWEGGPGGCQSLWVHPRSHHFPAQCCIPHFSPLLSQPRFACCHTNITPFWNGKSRTTSDRSLNYASLCRCLSRMRTAFLVSRTSPCVLSLLSAWSSSLLLCVYIYLSIC